MMEHIKRQTLDQCMREMEMDLNLDGIMDHLIAEGIMSTRDKERFEKVTTGPQKVQEFIYTLQTKGHMAYPVFLEALSKGNYKRLVTTLEKKEKRIRTKHTDGKTPASVSATIKKPYPPVAPKPKVGQIVAPVSSHTETLNSNDARQEGSSPPNRDTSHVIQDLSSENGNISAIPADASLTIEGGSNPVISVDSNITLSSANPTSSTPTRTTMSDDTTPVKLSYSPVTSDDPIPAVVDDSSTSTPVSSSHAVISASAEQLHYTQDSSTHSSSTTQEGGDTQSTDAYSTIPVVSSNVISVDSIIDAYDDSNVYSMVGVINAPQPGKGESNATDASPKSSTASSRVFCEELFQSLQKRFMEPFAGNLSRCNFFELEMAKAKILTEYDNQAQGPAKNDVREERKSALERGLTIFETPIADFALEDAIRKYTNLLLDIVTKEQYEEGDITRKFDEARDVVLKQFYDRCNGINDLKLNQNVSMLKDTMKDKYQHFLQVNTTLSQCLCEDARATSVANAFRDWKEALDQIYEIDTEEKINITKVLEELKEKHLRKYDLDAKGPAKQQVRNICSQEIDKDILRMKNIVVGITLETAMEMYYKKMEEIKNTVPYDEDILTRKHNEMAEQVQVWFKTRLKGFDDLTLSANDKLLKALTANPESQIVSANFNTSRKLCRTLFTEILQKTNNLASQFKKVVNVDNTRENYVGNLQKLKEDALKEYDSKAKGPCKNAFRVLCEARIDRDITSS